jgi:hypothetical protein
LLRFSLKTIREWKADGSTNLRFRETTKKRILGKGLYSRLLALAELEISNRDTAFT